MSKLTLDHLAKTFGETRVVRDLNLEVAQGEMVALLGPSGCGKTTTLRMIAGFITPAGGRILLDGEDISALPPYRRDTGMVFQSYALFPHMSVAANVGFGLEMRKVGRAEREQNVRNALDLVRLGELVDRMPRQLSGGQQQRVALARALAVNPKLLLLDEPLSNLDAKLRGEVQHEIRTLQQQLELTTVIVTHDQEEALTMADRLVVMEGGVERQIGTPRELYDAPADVFVAGFVGRCNLIEGRLGQPGVFISRTGTEMTCAAAPETMADEAVLALRPEKITIAPVVPSEVPATVTGVIYLGALTEYRLKLGGTELFAIIPTPVDDSPLSAVNEGAQVSVNWRPQDARLLSSRI